MAVSHDEVRRISIAAGTTVGAHIHSGPVFGTIEKGSVTFQIGDEVETTLRPGAVFYEPAGAVVSKFDTTDDDAVFLGCFLLTEGAARNGVHPAELTGSGSFSETRAPVVVSMLLHDVDDLPEQLR